MFLMKLYDEYTSKKNSFPICWYTKKLHDFLDKQNQIPNKAMSMIQIVRIKCN